MIYDQIGTIVQFIAYGGVAFVFFGVLRELRR